MSSRTPGAPSPLRLARQLRGMEIADVARALGNNPTWVVAMELGRRPIPAATLPRLATVLHVPVGMLTGEPVVLEQGADGWVVRLSGLPAPAPESGGAP